MAAIVGAFLAGMALSETVDRRVYDLTDGVTELLVPFFLAGIGLRLDLRVFFSPKLLLLAAVVLIAALLSKFVGCGLGAIAMGRRNAVRIGIGMMPRGEVGMVVAQISLALGVIGQGCLRHHRLHVGCHHSGSASPAEMGVERRSGG